MVWGVDFLCFSAFFRCKLWKTLIPAHCHHLHHIRAPPRTFHSGWTFKDLLWSDLMVQSHPTWGNINGFILKSIQKNVLVALTWWSVRQISNKNLSYDQFKCRDHVLYGLCNSSQLIMLLLSVCISLFRCDSCVIIRHPSTLFLNESWWNKWCLTVKLFLAFGDVCPWAASGRNKEIWKGSVPRK